MKRRITFALQFVEYLPEQLQERTLYVSVPFATAAHMCACGCGNQVITPITPTDWQMTFDGETISLHPSIGNWSFRCQSHYWIRHNQVQWAPRWTKQQIEAGREHDQQNKAAYFAEPSNAPALQPETRDDVTKPDGFWRRLKRRLR